MLKNTHSNLRVDIEDYLKSDELAMVPPPNVTNNSFSLPSGSANKSRLSKSYVLDTILGKPYRSFSRRRVRHQILDKHLTIAWDMDGTLINGRQSWFWRRWIRDNYRYHKFWILTFRDPRESDRIWSDLREVQDPLEEDWFDGMRMVEPALWNAWAQLPNGFEDLDHEAKLTDDLLSIAQKQRLDVNLIISINRAIRAWKAVECKKLNCSLLVEDREKFCKPYCDALGIQFINALTD